MWPLSPSILLRDSSSIAKRGAIGAIYLRFGCRHLAASMARVLIMEHRPYLGGNAEREMKENGAAESQWNRTPSPGLEW